MVDIRPDDRSGITGGLAHRNEMEARYAVMLDEIESTIDPIRHDPWPRHFSTSGANTAVRIQAVRRLPDFPVFPCGEDKALVRALEAHDLRVRPDPDARAYVRPPLRQGRGRHGRYVAPPRPRTRGSM